MKLDLVAGPAVAELDAALCSDGAPSARNLLVTVFGDAVVTAGVEIEVTVQELTSVVAPFGVNERLVRTSLSRLVNDDLLAVRSRGRRSTYRVAPTAIDLFAAADDRIYRGRPEPWDGHWTLVVLDGAESTPERRATLRQELAGIGMGVVAPNVLASPIVVPSAVADAVARVGGFEQVLVTRSTVVPGVGLADPVVLARRCVDVDELEQRYEAIADRFGAFDDQTLDALDEARATKLRLLAVATFRRVVLADPMLAADLLPRGWAGERARHEVARVYAAVARRSDRLLSRLLDVPVRTDASRFSQR